MIKFYDFLDKQIGGDYQEKPGRGFFPDEKYYLENDKKISNPNFKLKEAKAIRNRDIVALRATSYPPVTELADAIYWEKKGNSSKMDKYVANCAKVKKDLALH